MSSRREFLRSAALGSAALVVSSRAARAVTAPSVITVYKDPSCQCCVKWVQHLSANGFVATVRDVSNMDEIKNTMHVPSDLRSCHTAVVERYVIEGHVPADLVKKLLRDKPDVVGLAVPGMPSGSPGMEGGKKDAYSVIAFARDGKTSVFAKR